MDASDFYYPDELTDVNDILNATLTEHTIDKKRQVLGNLIATEKTAVSSAEDDAQFVAFIDQQRSENTKSKTKCDVNIFKTFILNLNETRELEQIPVKELDKLLCKFFMTIKRKDGNNYEPDTLTSIQRSIQRYLQQQNADFNIIKDNDFHLSREVLAARRKSLTEKEIDPMRLVHLPTAKKTSFSLLATLGKATPWSCRGLSGGCYLYSLGSVHETKVKN